MVRNLTIRIDDETSKKMDKYSEVNWSQVAREAIKKYVASRESLKRHDAAVKAHMTRKYQKQKETEE